MFISTTNADANQRLMLMENDAELKPTPWQSKCYFQYSMSDATDIPNSSNDSIHDVERSIPETSNNDMPFSRSIGTTKQELNRDTVAADQRYRRAIPFSRTKWRYRFSGSTLQQSNTVPADQRYRRARTFLRMLDN